MDPEHRLHVRRQLFHEFRRYDRVHKREIVLAGIWLVEQVNAKRCKLVGNFLVHAEYDVDIPLQVALPMFDDREEHDGRAVTAVRMACDKYSDTIRLF